jgi:hypothetical protein
MVPGFAFTTGASTVALSALDFASTASTSASDGVLGLATNRRFRPLVSVRFSTWGMSPCASNLRRALPTVL